MEEQKLRQLFKNRSNCYADAEDVVQAMDEDCFIETVNEALRLHDVSMRSELLFAFIAEIKSEFSDQNWDYLNFIADRVISKK